MRYIIKTNEPQAFTDWKKLENENWKPTFENLTRKVKDAIYESLLNEQGHICCYCERKLLNKDYHIEHLNARRNNAGDELDYSNLLCSCIANPKKGKPCHCGHLKDENLISVNPLQANCQSKFIFLGDGRIKGVDNDAKETIGILGLDHKKLIGLRDTAISSFYTDPSFYCDPGNPNKSKNEINELSAEDEKKYLRGLLVRAKDGKFTPFCSAIAYVYRDYLREDAKL